MPLESYGLGPSPPYSKVTTVGSRFVVPSGLVPTKDGFYGERLRKGGPGTRVGTSSLGAKVCGFRVRTQGFGVSGLGPSERNSMRRMRPLVGKVWEHGQHGRESQFLIKSSAVFGAPKSSRSILAASARVSCGSPSTFAKMTSMAHIALSRSAESVISWARAS